MRTARYGQEFRDQLPGKKLRGELNPGAGRVTCGELLDDLIEHATASLKESTSRIWKRSIEANIRPAFGHLKAVHLTTEHLKEYRVKRTGQGRSDVTANRELSILRIAFNLGRKCSPPKVMIVPWFPITKENNARQGFLTDHQYSKLRDALPDCIKPLLVTAYRTGVRLGSFWRGNGIRSIGRTGSLPSKRTKPRAATLGLFRS